jgi:hypothetical protein
LLFAGYCSVASQLLLSLASKISIDVSVELNPNSKNVAPSVRRNSIKFLALEKKSLFSLLQQRNLLDFLINNAN